MIPKSTIPLITAAACILGTHAHATDYTWGSGNGNWSATNWNPAGGGAAVAGSSVNGSSNTATISGAVTVEGDLKNIGGLAPITVSAGASFNIYNNFGPTNIDTFATYNNLVLAGGTITGSRNSGNFGAANLRRVTVTGTSTSTISSGSSDPNGYFNLKDISTGVSPFFDVQDAAGNLNVTARLADTAISGGWTMTGFEKKGLGTMTLSNTNTYTGLANITAGTLLATKAGALPGYNAASKLSVANGATLAVRAGGSGEWSSAEIDSVLGATTAAFASGSNLGIDVTIGNSFSYANNIGATQVAKGLVKSGAGTLTLSSGTTHTYTGATTVTAGKLVINGNISTSTTTVKTTGTLGGTGTVGAVIVQAGGTLAPGNSPGNITGTSLSLEDNANFNIEIDKSLTPRNDSVTLTGNFSNVLAITTGANLNLTLTGTFVLGDRFTLADYNTTNGTWNGGLFNLGAGTSTLADDSVFQYGSYDWRINYDDLTNGVTNSTESYTDGGKYLTLTVVPEPNVAALLGGLGMLALLRRRR